MRATWLPLVGLNLLLVCVSVSVSASASAAEDAGRETCGAGGCVPGAGDEAVDAALLQLPRHARQFAQAGFCGCSPNNEGTAWEKSFGHLVKPLKAKLLAQLKVTEGDVSCLLCPSCAPKGRCASMEQSTMGLLNNAFNHLTDMFEACEEFAYSHKLVDVADPCDCCYGDGPEQVAVYHGQAADQPGVWVTSAWVTWVQRRSDAPTSVTYSVNYGEQKTALGAVFPPRAGDPTPPMVELEELLPEWLKKWTDLGCQLCDGDYKGFFYRVRLDGIRYGELVKYQVGGKSYNFTLRPPSSMVSRVLVLGDAGTRGANVTYAALAPLVKKQYFDLLVSLGDFSYSNGYVPVYNAFFHLLEDFGILPTLPMLVTTGNHENVMGYAAYFDRFVLPPSSLYPQRPGASYYHVRNGNVHWISLNFEYENGNPPDVVPPDGLLPLNQSEFAWLEVTLAGIKEARKQGEWIVVYSHRPLYCSVGSCSMDVEFFGVDNKTCKNIVGECCGSDAERLRNATNVNGKTIEDLFKQYGVDVYMGAHVHAYERTYPIYQGHWVDPDKDTTATVCPFGDAEPGLCLPNSQVFTNPGVPVNILNGGAGTAVEQDGLIFKNPSPKWSASRIVATNCVVVDGWDIEWNLCYDLGNTSKRGGYGVLNANETHLTWAFIASVGHDAFSDSFVIHRTTGS